MFAVLVFRRRQASRLKRRCDVDLRSNRSSDRFDQRPQLHCILQGHAAGDYASEFHAQAGRKGRTAVESKNLTPTTRMSTKD